MGWQTKKGIAMEQHNEGNAKLRRFLLIAGFVAGLIGFAMLNNENERGGFFVLGGGVAIFLAGKVSAKRVRNSPSGQWRNITWW